MALRANATVKRSSATSHADLFRFARINDPRTLLDLLPRDAVLARGEVMVAMAHAQLRLALRSALFRISRVSRCARDVVQIPASAARREQDHATPPSPCAATPGREVPKPCMCLHVPLPREDYDSYSSSRPRSSTMRGGSLLKSLSRSQSGRTRTCVIPGQLNRSRPSG